MDSTGCVDQPGNKVVYLEHVHVVIDLGASKRGELQVCNCCIIANFEDIVKLSIVVCNGSFTPNNLLPTSPIGLQKNGCGTQCFHGLKPVRSDSREQIYFKIIWYE